MLIAIVVIVLLLFIAFYMVAAYNEVIKNKNQIENAEGSVNVILKKRHELIPNLTACVQFEQEQQQLRLDKLVQITKAINAGEFSQQRMEQEGEVGLITSSILAEVTGDKSRSVVHLQKAWSEMEEQISAARRFYNSAISQYNTCIESFPTRIIVSHLKLEKKEKYNIPFSQKFMANHNLDK